MPHWLRFLLGIIAAFGGAGLIGVIAVIGVERSWSLPAFGAGVIGIAAVAALGATWLVRLVEDMVKDEIETNVAGRYERALAQRAMAKQNRVPLPGDVEALQQHLADMLLVVGKNAADAIQLSQDLGSRMIDVAEHLTKVEDERHHYKKKAATLEQIADLATGAVRAPRAAAVVAEPEPDPEPTVVEPTIIPAAQPGPDTFARKPGSVPPAPVEPVAVPSFLRPKPEPRVDMKELERAVAAPA